MLDIGALSGIYSLVAASANKQSSIVAFEPHPNNFDLLCKNIQMNELWLNVNRRHAINKAHDHPFSFMSGVFFIKGPEKSGDLVLHNDHNKILYTQNFHPQYIKKWNSYNSVTYRIEPEENVLILFPSSVWHDVEPNLSDETRISLSFNMG